MRRSKRNNGASVPLRVLLVLSPALLLVVAFNALPNHIFDRNWPFGIEQEEVNFYKENLNFGTPVLQELPEAQWKLNGIVAQGEAFIADSSRSSKWGPAELITDKRSHRVRVRRNRLVEGGFVIKAERGSLINGKKQVVLIPATVSSIQSAYLSVLAEELHVPHPKVEVVSLSLNGSKALPFLMEERIDNYFAQRVIGNNSKLFEQCSNINRPECTAAAIKDERAAYMLNASLLKIESNPELFNELCGIQEFGGLSILMQCGDFEKELAEQSTFALRAKDNRIVPIRRSRRLENAEALLPKTSLLRVALRSDLISKNEQLPKLRSEIWRLKERFAQQRERFIPTIATLNNMPQSIALAQAEQIGDQILFRLSKVNDNVSLDSITSERSYYSDRISASPRPEKTIGQLAIKYKGWLEKDTLVLPRGRYLIEEDLIIPAGKSLKLLSGVRMFIAPNVNIHVKGPFSVRASSLRPCFIRPLNPDSSWGSIAVNMEEKQTSIINGLYISGGSEAMLDGSVHTAMLSFHNGNVVMSNSGISDGRGEDMINVKNGKVKFSNCSFANSYADLVDLDYVEGSVIKCQFKESAKDLNGDGLDLSASKLFIERCTFANCSDKGLSIGEESEALVMASIFYQDSIGVAVKDASIAHLYSCSFRENQTAFAAYQKKAWLGGAVLNHAGSVFYSDTPNTRKDDLSQINELMKADREIIFRFEPIGASPL